MAKKIVILGAGKVGKTIAIDLAEKYDVTAVDINPTALDKLSKSVKIETKIADVKYEDELNDVIKDCDLVVGALPGYMGFDTARKVILAGKDLVDISFFTEDPFELDVLAKGHNVTVFIDCGVAPGMSNVILGHYNKKMDVKSFECYAGGLPFKREWPYEYKAVFSPLDVIQEYIRPARIVINGDVVVREALSEPELVDFDEIGTLEAWNSDGLRSLLKTIDIPNMQEKTLRYPGSSEYLRVLRDTGFFSDTALIVDGHPIRPIDVTSQLLFPKWELKKGEEDFTLMRVKVSGTENGEEKIYEYNLFDKYDRETRMTSMARTTGYTCTAVVNLFLDGNFKRIGMCPPEFLGEDENNFKFLINYLKERNVNYELMEK